MALLDLANEFEMDRLERTVKSCVDELDVDCFGVPRYLQDQLNNSMRNAIMTVLENKTTTESGAAMVRNLFMESVPVEESLLVRHIFEYFQEKAVPTLSLTTPIINTVKAVLPNLVLMIVIKYRQLLNI